MPQSVSSLDEDQLAQKHAQELEDDETVDFGDAVDKSSIVVSSVNPVVGDETDGATSGAQTPIPNHGKEGTLLINSTLLEEVEKANGEIPVYKPDHTPVIVLIVILLGLAGYLGLHLYNLNHPEPEAPVAQEPEPAAKEVVTNKHLEATDTPISITPHSARILVNGVYVDPNAPNFIEGLYPLLIEHDNVITAYADGYVPYITRLPRDYNFVENPVSIEMMRDEFYQHSSVILKAPTNIDLSTMTLRLNGKPIAPNQEQRLDCLSGFPYFVEVKSEGKGTHLHVFWPTRTEETVQLPDLETAGNAKIVTVFALKLPKFYSDDKTLQVKINAENENINSAGTYRIKKAEFIDVSVKKNARYPMDLAFDSTPFGSITIDGYLQPASKGVAQVYYGKQSDKNVKVCFRRSSETVCATDDVSYVSSGKWEIVAYRELADGTREQLTDQPFETLKPDTKYTITIKTKGKRFNHTLEVLK